MKKTFAQQQNTYIETPRSGNTPVKIDTILAARMKDFLLSRRRIRWQERGE
jgi:hypothetical protein